MRDDDHRLLEARASGKHGVLAARRRVSDLASRMTDRARARRVEAGLNDAWLRLQFALLTDDTARVRSERAACEDLLREAQADARARVPRVS